MGARDSPEKVEPCSLRHLASLGHGQKLVMARLPAGGKMSLVLKTIATCSTYILSNQLYRLWSTGFEYTLLTALRSHMTVCLASGSQVTATVTQYTLLYQKNLKTPPLRQFLGLRNSGALVNSSAWMHASLQVATSHKFWSIALVPSSTFPLAPSGFSPFPFTSSLRFTTRVRSKLFVIYKTSNPRTHQQQDPTVRILS